MKVLYVCPRYHTNLHYPVKYLKLKGHSVKFFALRRGESEEYSALEPTVLRKSFIYKALNGVVNKPLEGSFEFKYAMVDAYSFYKRFKQYGPDVVILRPTNRPLSILTMIMGLITEFELILYTQSPKYVAKKDATVKLKEWCMQLLDVCGWITPVLGDPSSGQEVASKTHVPFVSEQETRYNEKEWFKNGYVNIIMVGKFQNRKQHVLLLKAFCALREEGYEIRLTLIGECSKKEHEIVYGRVKKYIKRNELEALVDIKTNLSYEAAWNEYVNHDLYVLPSTNERAAVSILEAMANSLPVICSSSNGTQCYVKRGVNGFVFDDGSLIDLKCKMRNAVGSRPELVEMGKESYKIVGKKHDPWSYVQKVTNIVRKRCAVEA